MDITPAKVGLFEKMLSELRETFFKLVHWFGKIAARLPGLFHNFSTNTAALLIASAIILLAILAVVSLIGLFYVHPRVVTLSNKTVWDDYVENTYMPHLLSVRARVNQDAAFLKSQCGDAALASVLGGSVSAFVSTMAQTLPQGDADCVTLLKQYFMCFNGYQNASVEMFGMQLFKLPDDPGDVLPSSSWSAIVQMRAALSQLAAAAKDANPTQNLWVAESAFPALSNGTVPPTSSTQTALLAACGSSYDHYIALSGAAARVVAGCMEMHLLLNVYHDDILVRYDSRQRRTWGNPYIFYYFLNTQTQVTGASLRTIWSDVLSNTQLFSGSLLKSWQGLGTTLQTLPRYLVSVVDQI